MVQAVKDLCAGLCGAEGAALTLTAFDSTLRFRWLTSKVPVSAYEQCCYLPSSGPEPQDLNGGISAFMLELQVTPH